MLGHYDPIVRIVLGQYNPILGVLLGQYNPIFGIMLGQYNSILGVMLGFIKPKIGFGSIFPVWEIPIKTYKLTIFSQSGNCKNLCFLKSPKCTIVPGILSIIVGLCTVSKLSMI